MSSKKLEAVEQALSTLVPGLLTDEFGPMPTVCEAHWTASLDSLDGYTVEFTGALDVNNEDADKAITTWANWLGARPTAKRGMIEATRDLKDNEPGPPGDVLVRVFAVSDRRAFEGDRYQP